MWSLGIPRPRHRLCFFIGKIVQGIVTWLEWLGFFAVGSTERVQRGRLAARRVGEWLTSFQIKPFVFSMASQASIKIQSVDDTRSSRRFVKPFPMGKDTYTIKCGDLGHFNAWSSIFTPSGLNRHCRFHSVSEGGSSSHARLALPFKNTRR